MQEVFLGVQESSRSSFALGDTSSLMNMALSSQESSKELKLSDSAYSMTDITLEQAVYRLHEIEKENLALRDNLRQHNASVKKQYETLAQWRLREAEKFEQTKALITALREENQELQAKLNDTEKEMGQKMEAVQEEKKQLQQQKSLSDQRLLNVCKLAEEQGIKGFKEDLQSDKDIVHLSTSDSKNDKLEKDLCAKDEIIAKLNLTVQKLETELANSHEQTRLLLGDMESQQKLKETMEEENRNLTTKIMDAEQKLHQQMQSVMASTKKEMEAEQRQTNPVSATSERVTDASFFSFPENMDDLMDIAKTLEAKQQEEIKLKELMSTAEKSQEEKLSLMKKIDDLKNEVEDLKSMYNNSQQQLKEEIMKSKETSDRLSQEYEHKLMEMARAKTDNAQVLQSSSTEDTSTLRCQVLTLIKELYDAQNKCSAALQVNSMKDNRIHELEQVNNALRQSTSEQLRAYSSQSERAHAENISIKQQYSKLQESFGRLVNDYKELQETFERYRVQMERQARQPRQPTKETMEEINRLTAQVIAADEAIAYRDEEIARLKAEKSNGIFNEEIHLLKFQADLFKSDFAAEREARTKLAEEKSKLEEELVQMREVNRTLKEELETFNQRQIRDIQRRLEDVSMHCNYHEPDTLRALPIARNRYADYREPQGGADMRPDEDEELKSFQHYDCPKCNTSFPDFDSLQLHVPDCIE